jgi:uncharacterized protein
MHPNEQLARRELDLINSGDWDALQELYTEDFVVHYPGRNPLSGAHSLGDFVDAMEGLLAGGTITRELHDALGTDDHAVQLLRVTGNAQGHTHTWNAAVVLHVREGRFSEAWINVDDQYGLDEFLNSLAQ